GSGPPAPAPPSPPRWPEPRRFGPPRAGSGGDPILVAVLPFPRPGLLAVAVAGLIALSACGDAFVSPAAVVGGIRISQAELDRAVRLDLATNPQDAFATEGPRGAESRANVTRSVLRT